MIGRRVPPAYAPIAPLAGLGRGGDPTRRLRERLLDRFGAADARLAGSGTQALRLAVRAALHAGGHASPPGPPTRGTGPLVAIPAYTCYDVAAAVLAETGRVACFDVDPETLAPDAASVERVLAAGPSVLVVSPLFGVPVRWEPLEAAVRNAGAVLVEDAAQGHGASWGGRPLGALGPLSVVSFARGKGWTGGAGGAVLARAGAADALRSLDALPAPPRGRAVGVVLAGAGQWTLGRPALYGVPASLPWLRLGETVYRPAPPPEAMPDVAARMALAAEDAADVEADVRRRRAAWLRTRVPSGLLVRAPPGGVPGWLRLPIRLADGSGTLPPAVLRAGLAPAYPRALPDLPQVRPALDGAGGPWPGAERLARELVTLPTHSLLRRHDAERLLRWVDSRHREARPRVAQPRHGRAGARGTPVAHEDSRE